MRGLSDVAELKDSIARIGLLQPLVLAEDNTLIAGRHRLVACKQLGWDKVPAVRVSLADMDRRLAEIDENLIRNELTALERAEHLAERQKLFGARPGRPQKNGAGSAPKPVTYRELSEKTRRSVRQLKEEVAIAVALPKDVRDVLRGSPVADNKEELKRLAKLSAEQRAPAAAALAGGLAKGVSDWRLQQRYAGRKAAALKDVDGRFDVICADPPWQYNNSGVRGAVADQYPTMSIDELRALPVAQRAAKSSVLFMWVTNPLLEDGLAVMRSWGFAYKTNLVWVKKRPTGAPFYVNGSHELVLLGVRGGGMLPDGKKPISVFDGENDEHSRKPECFYGIVEAMYPGLRYLELFARRPRDGWKAWGNDA
jgi:N6-adenosine-specific RNA methylase IME4